MSRRRSNLASSMSAALEAEPILTLCRAEGFSAVGVCDAQRTSREREIRTWIAQKKHGAMEWFETQVEARLDPSSLLPGVRSIICVADRYSQGIPDAVPEDGPILGKTARYARGLDYHRRMKRRLRRITKRLAALHPEATFRACSDIEPLLEREHAARAGLGRIGKHTLLIIPGQGSWVVLAEILTTLHIRPTHPRGALLDDPCGSCRACIDACPTGAIEPWSVDASRCLSHLHIEERGDPPAHFEDATEGWIFGCDMCQEVCPHNQPTRASRATPTHADYDGRLGTLPLAEIIRWTPEARAAAFERGALKRVTLSMARRNAIMAAADGLLRRDDPAALAAIRESAEDADPLVRAAARRALERLSRPATSA